MKFKEYIHRVGIGDLEIMDYVKGLGLLTIILIFGTLMICLLGEVVSAFILFSFLVLFFYKLYSKGKDMMWSNKSDDQVKNIDRELYVPAAWMGQELIKKVKHVREKEILDKKIEEIRKNAFKVLSDRKDKAKHINLLRKVLRQTIPYATKIGSILIDPDVNYSVRTPEDYKVDRDKWKNDNLGLKNSVGIYFDFYEIPADYCWYLFNLAQKSSYDRYESYPFYGAVPFSYDGFFFFNYCYYNFKLERFLHKHNLIAKDFGLAHSKFIFQCDVVRGKLSEPHVNEDGKTRFRVVLFLELVNINDPEFYKWRGSLRKSYDPKYWRHREKLPTDRDYDVVSNRVEQEIKKLRDMS